MGFQKKVDIGGKLLFIAQITGKEDIREFKDHINSLIRERAMIKLDMLQTFRQEKKWLAETARENRKGNMISLYAYDGKTVIAGCQARKGPWAERGNAELGIAISSGWRGRGLGKFMLGTLIGLVKKRWNSRNIYLNLYSRNARARRLYKSLGFVRIATMPGWVSHYGIMMDKEIMVLKGR